MGKSVIDAAGHVWTHELVGWTCYHIGPESPGDYEYDQVTIWDSFDAIQEYAKGDLELF